MTDELNTQSLTRAVTHCFNLSMSAALKQDERAEILVKGKLLRGYLLNLISAKFVDGTAEVQQANRALTEANTKLDELSQKLATYSDTLKKVIKALGALDKLLAKAAGFV